jgi:hypothetical protein
MALFRLVMSRHSDSDTLWVRRPPGPGPRGQARRAAKTPSIVSVTGPLKPGLVAEFGIARTTSRKAIRLLADEGLVTTVPARGTFVVRK